MILNCFILYYFFIFVFVVAFSVLMRNTTKCELLRDGVLVDSSNGGVETSFIFNCDKNGAFVSPQCNVDISSCWCVNQDGITVDGTIMKLGMPNCTTSKALQE